MIKVLGKSTNVASMIRSASATGASTILPIVPAVPEVEAPKYITPRVRMTAYSSAYNLPTKKMTVVSGPAGN